MYNQETKLYENDLGEKVPELLGITEFANFIGWNIQKAHVYYKRELLPKPTVIVGKRPLWTIKQAENFLDKELDRLVDKCLQNVRYRI